MTCYSLTFRHRAKFHYAPDQTVCEKSVKIFYTLQYFGAQGGFPGLTFNNPNGISIGSAVFAQFTAECPYTLQWTALSPSKLPLPMGASGPHTVGLWARMGPRNYVVYAIHYIIPWAHLSPQPKRHLDRFSRF